MTCKQILLLQTHPGSTMGSFPTVAFGGWQEPSRRIFPLFPTQISQQLWRWLAGLSGAETL